MHSICCLHQTNKTGIVGMGCCIQQLMEKKQIFDEKYRVVGIERDRLLLRGVLSGDVLTIVNSEPDSPLTPEQFPLGKLVALSDPMRAPLN